ncbi:PREDICTED: regulator of G-protein signaling 7 [Gekko japonicus]|uniref:Regulator of G-protein signaling 7 n=1 Tax=Gekko japonicus TaxID=146911 RepID=A0ABM1KU21_GEKJA|nr:PREDICTED: regulator of G-protein signaling 7 [Gekko japonicus]
MPRHFYIKKSKLIVPLEAITLPNVYQEEIQRRYLDILDSEKHLKPLEDLPWWQRAQIESRFIKDKKIGFYKNLLEIEKIIIPMDLKLIRRLYVLLIDYLLLDEIVKGNMIQWAQNIGHNINLEQWDQIWKKNIKITKAISYKENVYNMFNRWYVTPERLDKIDLKCSNKCWKVEALHLGTLMAAYGYFFPISDHVLTLKDDGTFYRFQTPYFWPSNCWEPENTDYAVYLCKRTMQNKARLELADYEAESLARLQRAFARKWEFIFMQAEAQAKVDKKRDKIERKILDSQERAFWDVHRPVPGCVNTTEMDIKKSSRMRNPHKTRKSVYGLQNDIRSHSPTHTPVPETKPPTEDELRQEIKYWQIQLDRHRLKMSKVAESLVLYTEQYVEYDPFLVAPDPSNPWLSDDTTFWEIEASKEPSQQRVKRWAFRMDEALKDPVGREQFLKFLESEFSSENLRFWLAVEDLKRRPIREVPARVQEIWQEFLAPGAPSAINLDSKSYDKTTQNVKEAGRYTFGHAQEHIYKLMKSDSYPRFIRSSAYQELLQAKKKFGNTMDRRTSFEKFTRNVALQTPRDSLTFRCLHFENSLLTFAFISSWICLFLFSASSSTVKKSFRQAQFIYNTVSHKLEDV